MKYELILTGRFKKGLKLARRRGLNISLLEDIRECHIQPNWLLIYLMEDDTLTLIDTGTHADLFDE